MTGSTVNRASATSDVTIPDAVETEAAMDSDADACEVPHVSVQTGARGQTLGA